MSKHFWHPDNLIEGNEYCFHYITATGDMLTVDGMFLSMEAEKWLLGPCCSILWLWFRVNGLKIPYEAAAIIEVLSYLKEENDNASKEGGEGV